MSTRLRSRVVTTSELDQVVYLLVRLRSEDDRGQIVEGWRELAAVSARVRPVMAREVFRDGAVQALGSVVFAIRYRPDVLASMAVRWHGRVYELMGEPVDIDGAHHTLELIAGTRPI